MLDDLERWAAGARAQEAADERSRERWLRQAAEESASFTGLLLDLAEEGEPVSVTTTEGRRHHGRIAAVGVDFVAIGGKGTRLVLVRKSSVSEVRPAAGSHQPTPATGREVLGVTLSEVLAQAVANRPRVVVASGDATVAGEFRAIGDDVLTIVLDGEPKASSYVTLAPVSEVSFLDSG